jgi:hypothetical protein
MGLIHPTSGKIITGHDHPTARNHSELIQTLHPDILGQKDILGRKMARK